MAAAHGLSDLPLGCFVATANLVEVMPTDRVTHLVGNQELAWGNYAPGRYAWLFDDVEPLAIPIPWRGMQSMFSVPDDVFGLAETTEPRA